MMHWREPIWIREYRPANAADVTDEQIDRWKADNGECLKENFEKSKALSARVVALRREVDEVYSSLEHRKKLHKLLISPAPPCWSFPDHQIKTAKEAKAKAEQQKADEVARMEQTQRAIVWLQARGKMLGADFTLETAIPIANGIAFDEEVAKQKGNDGWFDFNGQNCDGPCDGWDGESRRCQCGNRRVSWEAGWGHSFEKPYIVAEAY